MNKLILSISILAFIAISTVSKAQTVLPLIGADCNGVNHDLYSDLDSGKASILFFWMPSCGSCPPPAQKIQKMVNNILVAYPNKVTAYAMPFNNTTSCATSSNWTSSNSLPLYKPYDSGATQVANYGGFGMPTVVLLGGKGANRRVLFSTLSFTTSDTTTMRDSILNILKSSTATLSLDCPNITTMGSLKKGTVASGAMIHVPYTYTAVGNTYPQMTVNSTLVTGLTATLNAGTYSSSGSLRFDISGTPPTAGDAQFVLYISGTSCTYKFAVADNGSSAISSANELSEIKIHGTNNKLFVQSNIAMSHSKISMYDLHGKLIMSKEINIIEGQNEMNHHILNTGIYIVNIANSQMSKSAKIIIE